MTSWFEDAFNGSGRIPEFPEVNPIDPSSGPRKTLLKTRIVKTNWETTSKPAVSRLDSCVLRGEPFKPVQIEIHRDVSIRNDHSLKSSGLAPSGLFPGNCGAEYPEWVAQKQKQRKREITQKFSSTLS